MVRSFFFSPWQEDVPLARELASLLGESPRAAYGTAKMLARCCVSATSVFLIGLSLCGRLQSCFAATWLSCR